MDDKQNNKLIGYAVLGIIGYYILQMIIPLLFYALIGMVIWRVYSEYHKHKK